MAKKKSEMYQLLVEMRVPKNLAAGSTLDKASELESLGFELDKHYEPIPAGEPADSDLAMELDAADEEIVIVRGTIKEDKIDELKEQENVVGVWNDTKIAPFE